MYVDGRRCQIDVDLRREMSPFLDVSTCVNLQKRSDVVVRRYTWTDIHGRRRLSTNVDVRYVDA